MKIKRGQLRKLIKEIGPGNVGPGSLSRVRQTQLSPNLEDEKVKYGQDREVEFKKVKANLRKLGSGIKSILWDEEYNIPADVADYINFKKTKTKYLTYKQR